MEFLPPFDAAVHLKCVAPEEIDLGNAVLELRARLKDFDNYCDDYCTDHQLLLFLTARNFDLDNTYSMMVEALNWRAFRKPHEVMLAPNWHEEVSSETSTGKIYNPGILYLYIYIYIKDCV
jgi:hypothetical protein